MGELKVCASYPRFLVCSDGYLVNAETGRIVEGSKKKTGYIEACIAGERGGRNSVLLHRLIAEAFCEKPEGACEVNHINGDKTDNRAENLEWVTREQNLQHAFNTGLMPNNTSPRSVIATSIETGEKMVFPSIYKAARFLGISQGNICLCCKKERPYAGGYFWEYEN